MKYPAFLFAFVFFASAVSASTLTTQQAANLSFPFSATQPVSSVFVYFPENWQQASPNDFSCPVDWFKNADTQRRVHCACPAPCTNFLAAGFIGLSTRAPATPGPYSFIVLAYPPKGPLASNASVVFDVQNPSQLSVESNTAGSWLTGLSNPVELTVINTGQATAQDVHLQVRGFSNAVDVSLPFVASPSGAFTLRANETQRVLLNVTPPQRADALDVAFDVLGSDANNGQPVTRSISRRVVVLNPAALSLRLVPPSRTTYSANEFVTIGVHVQNTGETSARDVNLTLNAGQNPVQSAFFTTLGPGETQPVLFAPTRLPEGTKDLRVTGKFVEQTQGLFQNVISAPVAVDVQRPATLRLQAEPLQLDASQSKRVELFLFNDGQAASQNTTVALLDVSEGCELIGLSSQFVGRLADAPSVTDWVIQSPPYAANCKAYFQATGADANAQTTVQTPIFELSIDVRLQDVSTQPEPTQASSQPAASSQADLSIDAIMQRLGTLVGSSTSTPIATPAPLPSLPVTTATPESSNTTQVPITGLVAFPDNPILLPLGVIALLALLFATEWFSRKGFRKKPVDLIEFDDDERGLNKEAKE